MTKWSEGSWVRGARRAMAAGCCALGALAAASAWSQTQVLVEFDGEMLPVVAIDGEFPLVQVGGQRFRVEDARVSVRPAEHYTDGAVEVLSSDALMGESPGSRHGSFFFRFSAELRPERDFEDCFILFAVNPERGEPTHLLRAIPDIMAVPVHRLLVTLPVNPGFGGGVFAYKLYSGGEEIETIDVSEPLRIRRDDGTTAQPERSAPRADSYSSSRPARVAQPRLPDFPRSLVGVISGGYAEAVYSIGEDGTAVELLELIADHAELIPETHRSIVESRYVPGSHEGKPLLTTVRQAFFFNEVAPFPEEIIMIPYPAYRDRDATPIYTPLPSAAGRSGGEVKVELMVDTLGRPHDARIVSGDREDQAEAALAAIRKWIFLPAVVDGYPADQTLTVPIRF